MANCNRCGEIILQPGTCVKCSTTKIDNYEILEKENKQLKDKLHHQNIQIKELKEDIRCLKVDLRITENNLRKYAKHVTKA